MSNKKLMLLALVAIIVVLLASLQSQLAQRQKAAAGGAMQLIQGLDSQKIDRIELMSGPKQVVLQRQGDSFVIATKDNYPALTRKINDLIVSCLDITVKELTTSNPANHAELEVDGEKLHNLVKFFGADGKLITGVIVGRQDPQLGGKYVRLADKDDVYISDNIRWMSMTPLSYAQREIFKVEKSDIRRVTVTYPEGSYTLRADDQGKITLENIPPGKELKGNYYEQVFAGPVNIEFDDVQKKTPQTADLNFAVTLQCELKDSTLATFKLAKKQDKNYLICQADFTDKSPVVKENRVESPEELKAKEAKILARDAAAEFTQKHQGWVYEIGDWKAQEMSKKLDDLLQDKKQDPNRPAEEQKDPNRPVEPPQDPNIPAKDKGEK